MALPLPHQRLHFVSRQRKRSETCGRVSFERIELERIDELRQKKIGTRSESQLESEARPCRVGVVEERCVKRYSVVAPELVSANSVSSMPGVLKKKLLGIPFGLAPWWLSLLGAGVLPTAPTLPVGEPGVENAATELIEAPTPRENVPDEAPSPTTTAIQVV